MTEDRTPMAIGEVRRFRISKYLGGPPGPGEPKEPFEVIEGDDRGPTRVVFRRPGAPPESYADLPYEPEENDHAQG